MTNVFCVAVDLEILLSLGFSLLKYPQLEINFLPFLIISKDKAPD